MQKAYSAILVLLLITNCLFSQTGTIKIAKSPAAKKDPIAAQKNTRAMLFSFSPNFTFKKNKKSGGDIEALVGFYNNHCFVGLKYCIEMEYYRLSPYNIKTLQPETAYSESQTESSYLKVPIGISTFMLEGAGIKMGKEIRLAYALALVPEYLLKTKNQYARLSYSDFNQFNLGGCASIGFHVKNPGLTMSVSYSRDFFENLKDRNIYNETGAVVDKQKSKTNLVAFSISYKIGLHRK